MAKMTVRLPDDLTEAIKVEANGNVSAWVAKVCEEALLRAAVRMELAAERKAPGAFTSHEDREAEMEEFRS
ncbi:hypothetical protein D7D52_28470 [Nocardia yunnanensis]|uniref:Toxin-antitoxin system HicB family antitoxin n=1 Tax=Nocardia yunnanensis TaxID=2382165 RepID=A0A386ZKG8_9NOCA|nr:hypothetical protein [Nocardia yunnanensis]AYF77095.1 hypothetical protein D7D52_28470 [Nocardia yunnanensis]